jgi:hypothetical protein
MQSVRPRPGAHVRSRIPIDNTSYDTYECCGQEGTGGARIRPPRDRVSGFLCVGFLPLRAEILRKIIEGIQNNLVKLCKFLTLGQSGHSFTFTFNKLWIRRETTCRIAGMADGCRMRRGASTGPRTAEGLARSRRTRWKHGLYSAEALAEQTRA